MTLPRVFTGSLPGRSPAPERKPDDGESRGRELDPAGRPGTGRGPLSGQADDGKRPDDGKRTDPGKRPDFGRGPDTGSRPDTGRGPDTGSRPDTGKRPDTSREASDRSGPPGPAGSLGRAGAAVLMLADARFPAGGHAHSGGLEGAVTDGAVTDVGSLDLFLRGRLATTGVVAGALAAVACAAARTVVASQPPEEVTGGVEIEGGPVPASPVPASQPELSARAAWAARLDAEADARTPSPAQREASRRQGRALLRAARAAWPGPWLADLNAAPQPPHHAVVLGATAAAAGCSPGEAALIAAYLTVTGPASAAVRLLALDPIEVSAMIARLAGAIETAAARGAAAETDDLPYPSAPALDLYAEAHARAEVRLFAS